MQAKSVLAAIVALSATGLTVGAAHATPPQDVIVTDALYGVNDTHIFLLRSLDDNMGNYVQTQTDVLLVARNRITNVDDDIWPVARSLAISALENGSLEGRVQFMALDGAINPFDILQEQGAEPLMGKPQPAAVSSDTALAAEGDLLVLTDTNGGLRHQIGYAAIGALLADNLDRSRAALPAYFAEADIDVLQGVTFDVQKDCVFAPSLRISDSAGQIARLVAVTCKNDESLATVSTYLVMPPA